MRDLLDIAVVFLPLLGAAIAGLLGRVIGNRASQFITCVCVLAAAVFSVIIFRDVALTDHLVSVMSEGANGMRSETRVHENGSHVLVLADWIQSGTFTSQWAIKIDTLTAVMLLVVNGVSSMVHVYSVGYMSHDKSIPRFMSYLSLFTFFMLMLVVSDNLLQLFFGWEGVGLASYLLINFWYEKGTANSAAIKAFIVNRVGDFGFAIGIFGAYMLFGSIQFSDIFAKAPDLASAQWDFLGYSVPALTTVCLLLFIGAMGKSAQLGLHTWLADAMEGPTPVSALIHAATMVTAGVFMVCRLSPVFEYSPDALAVVAVVGALTCIVAATIGLTQFDIKRVIAYSTMSQLGYMFFAAGMSAYSAAMFHLVTHACFKALLFLSAGSVIHALSGEQDMRKMGGIWRKIPVTYALMWIGSLALAGIGIDGVFGFAGFYSKDLILETALASNSSVGLFAYILGVFAAFMTAFYSWRLIFMTFHGKPRADQHTMEHVHESPLIMLMPLMPLALGAVCAGWFAFDWFGGDGVAAFWKDAIFVLPDHDPIAYLNFHDHDTVSETIEMLKPLPTLVASLGIALAYVCYVVKPLWPAKLATGLGALYVLVFNKYYFDEILAFLFVQPALRLAKIFWLGGDENIIDRYGPDGIAALSRRIAKRMASMESGYIYHYAFAMVMGVTAFLSWFWLKG